MVKITSINVLYSNEAILEIDKVSVTLKNDNDKGTDVLLTIVIREKSGQDLLTQDFELFIGEHKTSEYIIPLDIPITGNFPCEFKVSTVIDGKVEAESEWRDLIESEETGTTIVDNENKMANEDTEVTLVENSDFASEEEEDTQTEIMMPNVEENPIVEEKTPKKKKVELPQQESWGILLEEGQDELYEEKIKGEIQPEKKSKVKKKKTSKKAVKNDIDTVNNEKEEFNEKIAAHISGEIEPKEEETEEMKSEENEEVSGKEIDNGQLTMDNEEKRTAKKGGKEEEIDNGQLTMDNEEKRTAKKEIKEEMKSEEKKEEEKIEEKTGKPKEEEIEQKPINKNKSDIINVPEEKTTEVNIIETQEEEITPTLTENRSIEEINKNEESEENIEQPMKKDTNRHKEKRKKEKKSFAVLFIIIIILVLGSGYVFKDKLLSIVKGNNESKKNESIDNLLTTDKDNSNNNLLNLGDKAKYKIEAYELNDDQLNSLEQIIDSYNGQLIENNDKTYNVTFEPKDKDTYNKIKEKLRSLNIKIK